MDNLMMKDFKLPLVGLATSYCEFSKEDPEAEIRQLHGGLKRLLATELAMARCEFGKQVQTIFSKLGINRKDQLAKFVW